MAGPLASKSLIIIGVCKPTPPCPSHHRIEITGAAASRSEEPLAAIEHGRSGAVVAHKLGRKPKLTRRTKMREAIRRRDRDGEPVREIARSYNVSQSTISRLTA
jgi:hypothetical protein